MTAFWSSRRILRTPFIFVLLPPLHRRAVSVRPYSLACVGNSDRRPRQIRWRRRQTECAGAVRFASSPHPSRPNASSYSMSEVDSEEANAEFTARVKKLQDLIGQDGLETMYPRFVVPEGSERVGIAEFRRRWDDKLEHGETIEDAGETMVTGR
ncbi:hypothetical protein BDY21DRAFT_352666 [Lineolata rhizophorae]|uniref:Uncharacterized protein n=1 Tax=Lineolata rhizophorae TaxID=578093 RepID=A0A6A6NSJ8_9PEZI|nr:hypothetical protein BDY21DRAFT_352666 [Lineolata rhizophorae]